MPDSVPKVVPANCARESVPLNSRVYAERLLGIGLAVLECVSQERKVPSYILLKFTLASARAVFLVCAVACALSSSIALADDTITSSVTPEPKAGTRKTVAASCVDRYHQLGGAYLRLRRKSPEEISEREQASREVWRQRYEATLRYLKEVKESRGVRIFLRERKADEPEPVAYGYWTLYDKPFDRWYHHFELLHPMFWVQLPFRAGTKVFTGKNYSFSPFEGAFHSVVHAPVRAATYRLLGKDMQPTLPVTVPLKMLGYGILLFEPMMAAFHGAFDMADEQALGDSLQEEYGPEYDEIIENDFRFKAIRIDLANGYYEDPITLEHKFFDRKMAREAAFKLLNALNEFNQYALVGQKEDSPEIRRMRFREYYKIVAPTMGAILDAGKIDQGENFIFDGDERPFTDKEVDQLILAQNEALLRMDLVRAYVQADETELANIEQVPMLRTRLDKIKAGGYAQLLGELHQDGTLSKGDFWNALQMNEEWKRRFETAPIMGLVPITTDENGVRPLEIVDTQERMLQKIAEQFGAK